MELLGDLPPEDRRQILAGGRRRRFAAREVLFHEGDPADSFLLLDTGRVAIRASTPVGDIVTFAVLGPGDVLGELALIGGDARRSATVVALEDVEAWAFTADTFHRLRREVPGAEAFFLQTLADDVRRLSGLLLEALYLPVEARVLRRVIDLERTYRRGPPPTDVPLNQDTLASLAGSSRATVNKVLRAAEDAGLVSLRRGGVVVNDPDALAHRGTHRR
ncbi:Crp/Fnr family transcriptional regulator [Actinomycetospora sp. NBRC 106375]|uniref:Crp/Fnr family transcriptional regulator n=1 Tax=Actinomycetospora sp. NBRC 106375 TaxID=3032207 RepID=UPI0024A122B6|nr:Crp/Fnr family transcriptional regulator [Actinomycetospora sp. NBRC 106375]GLZ46418.1 Crp/Fnr family transcriptional regulator [Actinomycetospora sp. NBRC 106375]